jgi:phytoene dehydrogenase-like protein
MTKRVAVVGAGLSGLTCARTLDRAGLDVAVFEASDGLGGRVRTDEVDGFLLDRGFQVFLDSYPEAARQLDLDALDLRAFHPGAVVRRHGRLHVVADPLRRPLRAVSSLLAPVGSLADKLRVARLRQELLRNGGTGAFGGSETTARALETYGFSAEMRESFFRPFLAGVFLESRLDTSAAKFAFVFRMFSRGRATIPSGGMRRIPEQLARGIEDRIRLRTPVAKVSDGTLTLSSREQLHFDAVVVAVEEESAARLTGASSSSGAKSATTIYFDADEPPVEGPWLVLNGDSEGLVNHLAVMTEVCPDYAPKGRCLVSVTTLAPATEGLASLVQRELGEWFGRPVRDWRHIRTCRTMSALPEEKTFSREPEVRRPFPRTWQCGDYLGNASIDGAMMSGRLTAEAMMEEL